MKQTTFLQRKVTLFAALIITAVGNFGFVMPENAKKIGASVFVADNLFEDMLLFEKGMKKEVFEKALAGWQRLAVRRQLERPNLLSIADMSQSSNSKRLYVLDMEKKTVVFTTYVAHGKNSGEEFARSFGNVSESNKSSLGFYLTGPAYSGKHGLSMRLKGLEKGINNSAEERGIVLHGASYVSESFIRQNGRLGRSQGCPAVPEVLCTDIVNLIKDGSAFFVFYPDENYFQNSVFYN